MPAASMHSAIQPSATGKLDSKAVYQRASLVRTAPPK
jgi:hypothetical protein